MIFEGTLFGLVSGETSRKPAILRQTWKLELPANQPTMTIQKDQAAVEVSPVDLSKDCPKPESHVRLK